MNFFEDLVNEVSGGVYVIAEGCDNHMGSTIVAKALVDAAVDSGADAIKFQHHIVEEEMLINDLSSDNFAEPLHEFLRVNALSLDQHYDLKHIAILIISPIYALRSRIKQPLKSRI